MMIGSVPRPFRIHLLRFCGFQPALLPTRRAPAIIGPRFTMTLPTDIADPFVGGREPRGHAADGAGLRFLFLISNGKYTSAPVTSHYCHGCSPAAIPEAGACGPSVTGSWRAGRGRVSSRRSPMAVERV